MVKLVLLVTAMYYRCCEVMKKLRISVGILELNDQGSYVPVSIEERKDVKTGGIYVLRQVIYCLRAYIEYWMQLTIAGSISSYSSESYSI